METGNVDQIFDEISQLREQYEAEVGRTRKAWPKSIRERVVCLAGLGLRYKTIATRSEISSNTIYSWMKRKSEIAVIQPDGESASFISVPVRSTEASLPPVQKRAYRVRVKTTTVTVKIRDRAEISGLSAAEALELLLGLKI